MQIPESVIDSLKSCVLCDGIKSNYSPDGIIIKKKTLKIMKEKEGETQNSIRRKHKDLCGDEDTVHYLPPASQT